LGHKVHPNAFRLGVYRTWEANWFALDKDYTKLLHEDLAMRGLIMKRLRNAGIARIETERSSNAQMTVTIHTAKPGIVIGKGGASVDQLRSDLETQFGNRVRISIQEIKQPELDAQLVAENIASQLERRISHRRAMKQSILRTMRSGAKGVRIALAGRLRGAEMARREWDREGRVPLHTLRADIQFGRATAKTTFGMIGIKVWIYRDMIKGRTRGGEAAVEIAPQPTAADVANAQQQASQPGQGGPGGPGGRPGGQRPRRRGGRGRSGGGGGQGGGGTQGGGGAPQGGGGGPQASGGGGGSQASGGGGGSQASGGGGGSQASGGGGGSQASGGGGGSQSSGGGGPQGGGGRREGGHAPA
jgi:small subunit ribosomal protein S3